MKVNQKKWDRVEAHEDVRVGDRLKIIETEKIDKTLTEVRTYRGRVTDVRCGDFYLSDGTVWDDEDPAPGETVKVYRRKPTDFEFPTSRLAIVKGQRKGWDNISVNFVKTDSGWVHQSGSEYTVSMIEQYFHNFKVIFAGVDE